MDAPQASSAKRTKAYNVDETNPSRRKAPRKEGAACAECRRLKHRCNRQFPCESCIKRGCASICPDGSLTTGKGNRFVLAGSEELHIKIASLSERIRMLEDALREAHAKISGGRHDLLSDALLKIKSPLERPYMEDENDGEADETRLDAFGSLSIWEEGRATFYGQPANSWYFLVNGDGQGTSSANGVEDLTEELLSAVNVFPLGSSDADRRATVQANILRRLPPQEKAYQLVDIYFERAAWLHNPISYHDVLGIFDAVYRQSPAFDTVAIHPHKLSVMLLILAIGTLMDNEEKAYSITADNFFYVSKAAMGIEGVFESTTLIAVQALLLMAVYLFYAEKSGSGASRWGITGIAVRLAQSIGLHRDSARFQLDEDDALQRRKLFWELFAYESVQCFTFGRPPSFNLAHIDCKMPEEPQRREDDEYEMSFHAWKHRFTKECLTVVHDECFGGKPPTYSTVQKIDAKIRNFYVPPSLRIAGFHAGADLSSDSAGLSITFQRHVLHGIVETILMYMHRNFLARAMNENPADPLKSPFGHSVLATYRSACSLLVSVKSLHKRYPETLSRIWFIWSHVFSASVVLGSIVTKCPSIALAPSAIHNLRHAVVMFREASGCLGAEKALPMMEEILKKSEAAFSAFREQRSTSGGEDEAEITDPLATLGGNTRFVYSKYRNSGSDSPSVDNNMGDEPNTTSSVESVPSTLRTADTLQPIAYYMPMSNALPEELAASYVTSNAEYSGGYQVMDGNQGISNYAAFYPTVDPQWNQTQFDPMATSGPNSGMDSEATWHNFISTLDLYKPAR